MMSHKTLRMPADARPLCFTNQELERIVSLFDARCDDVGDILSHVENVCNDRLRLISHVYSLNVEINHSRFLMSMLIATSPNVLDRIVQEIEHRVPHDSYVRMFFLLSFSNESFLLVLCYVFGYGVEEHAT